MAVLRRILQALQDKDMNTIRNLYSHSLVFRGIGPGADEIWNAETYTPVLEVQLGELPSFDISVTHIEAYERGDIAWGSALADITLANGRTLSMRYSMVFAIEDGMWRCVHHHNSVPADSREVLGVMLTTTLTDLLDSLDADTLAPIERDEGTATLMFTDIVDSTVLAQKMGDQRWTVMIEEHNRLIVEAAEKCGGTVIKTLGDGALISFGGVRSALRCSISLQAEFAERPFAVRIGIHAGEVVRTEDDVVGVTVHKAARVAAAAVGGQVVVSSIVRQLVGESSEFSFGEPFVAELKGIEGVHELTPLDLGPS